MRRRFLAMFILLFFMFTSQVFAEDNFLYGIQIFNRPIDWYWYVFNQSKEQGIAVVRGMVNLAADAGYDIVRGGPEFHNMLRQNDDDGEQTIWGLEALLPLLAEKGLMLDWPITGTGKIGITNPPDISDWKRLTGIGARIVSARTNQPEVIYEIWNEPDLKGEEQFWDGTCGQYYDYFNEAYNAIRREDTDAKIINGGLVLGNTASEAGEYLRRSVELLRNGKIHMLAIHSHALLDSFLELWRNDAYIQSAEPSKIFLNEAGLSMEDNGITITDNNAVKAYHSIGKMLAAKRLGLGGIVLFHMGGLNRGSMMDELKEDSYGQYHYYSYMLTLKNDNTLEPNEIYYAAKTAIAHTKGLEADVSWPLEKKNGSYVWLFQNEEGRKTLAYLNREGGHPEAADLVKAFGSEGGYDAVYNITGDKVAHGTDSMILYYVKNAPVVTPEPTVPTVPVITTKQSDLPKGKEGELFSHQFKADMEGVTWSYTGYLPAGLTFSKSGLLSGTPSASGNFTFTLTAAKSGAASVSATFTLTVDAEDKTPPASPDISNPPDTPEPPVKPVISTKELPQGKFGDSYDFTLTADTEGGVWTLEGTLPDGLSFNPAAGRISGTPETYGEWPLTAYISVNGEQSEKVSYTLKIESAGTIIITTTQADFDAKECKAGQYYSIELKSYPDGASWSMVGLQPSNLVIRALKHNGGTRTVTLSGTPAASGHYEFRLYARLTGWEPASEPFVLDIQKAGSDSSGDSYGDNGSDNGNEVPDSSGGGGCSSGFRLLALFAACLVSFIHAEHNSRS